MIIENYEPIGLTDFPGEIRMANDWNAVMKAANGRPWRLVSFLDIGIRLQSIESGELIDSPVSRSKHFDVPFCDERIHRKVFVSKIEISFDTSLPDDPKFNMHDVPRLGTPATVGKV